MLAPGWFARRNQPAKFPKCPGISSSKLAPSFDEPFHAAKLHQTLKLSLLFHEVSNKIGQRVNVAIGDIIPNARLRSLGDRRVVTEYLKEATHRLKPQEA